MPSYVTNVIAAIAFCAMASLSLTCGSFSPFDCDIAVGVAAARAGL